MELLWRDIMVVLAVAQVMRNGFFESEKSALIAEA